MTLTEPTERGHENWAALDRKHQMRAARWLARRLRAGGGHETIGDDVCSVGFGWRERGSRLYRRPVLVVVVHRKRKSGSIPAHVQATIPTRAGRRVLAVPVDVCEEDEPCAHNLPNGCRVEPWDGEGPLKGSVAALVRNHNDEDGPHYLLGCHHVIFRSAVTHNAEPDDESDIVTSEGDAAFLGVPTRPAPFGRDRPSVDAALIRLGDEGFDVVTDRDFWHVVVRDYIETEDDLDDHTDRPWKLVSRHDPAPFKFVRTRSDKKIKYGSNDVPITIVEVIESRATRRWPRRGDSGGAIVSGNTLIGVHIAGKGKTSYSIPAYMLFSSSVFSPRLVLADDWIP